MTYRHATALSNPPEPSSYAEWLLDTVRAEVSSVDHVLGHFADASIAEYLAQATRDIPPPLQDRGDLIEAVEQAASELLGADVARGCAAQLEHLPAVLTGNHHGFDSFAQQLQQTVLFSRRHAKDGAPARAAIALACATVPLNNLTYPRGFLLYAHQETKQLDTPMRLPVFPDRSKRDAVCFAKGFDGDMVARALKRCRDFERAGKLGTDAMDATATILEEVLASDRVLAESTYKAQATLVNFEIGRRLVREPTERLDLVVLALEDITARLLVSDARDATSLLSATLLDDAARQRIVHRLDGARSCWSVAKEPPCPGLPPGDYPTAGTVFFWGRDGARLTALGITADRPGACATLVDCTTGGELVRVKLEPDSLCEALAESVIVPSVFTSYLVTALARGMCCLGGYYQALYLPVMQQAVVEALQAGGRTDAMIAPVAASQTDRYLSGMQGILCAQPDGTIGPAGPVEILAAGGLATEQLTALDAIDLATLHRASLRETIADLRLDGELEPAWRSMLGSALAGEPSLRSVSLEA